MDDTTTPPDARGLSRGDYAKLKRDTLRDLTIATHGDRPLIQPTADGAPRPDARAMDREAYAKLRDDARNWRAKR
jgi:hypothetical protein